MGFTGRLGTGNSRLGNILLAAVDTLGDGTFDYQVHQVESNKIRVVFNTQIRIPSATDPTHFSLDIVSAPGSYVIPNIVNITPYDADNESIVLNLDKNLTTGATYTLELGEIFDVNGDTVSFIAKNFDANVTIPPLARGAYQSKNGHVDILFDKNVGATATTSTASIRDAAGGPLTPMTLVVWAGEGLPDKTLRFQLPGGMPAADSFIIEYANVEDESYNIGAGEVPLTLALRTAAPYDFNALNQIQPIDAYVTDLSNDQINTTNLRVYFNGPINGTDALDTANWDIRAQDIHKNLDVINIPTAPEATDESSLGVLVYDLVENANAHFIEPQVHFQNTPSLVVTPPPVPIVDPYNLSVASNSGLSLDVDAQIFPGPSTSLAGATSNNDGSLFFAMDAGNNNRVYEYSAVINWEVNTASYTGNFFSFAFAEATRRLTWADNGNRLFVMFNGNLLRTFTAGIPFDITTLVWDGTSVILTTGTSLGIAVNSTGTRFYTCGSDIGGFIEQYEMIVPYDINTLNSLIVFTDGVNIPGTVNDIDLSPDGLHIYGITQNDLGTGIAWTVFQFDFPVADDIGSAVFNDARYTGTPQQNDSVFVGKNGERLYFTQRAATGSIFLEEIVQWNAGFTIDEPATLLALEQLQINFADHLANGQIHYFPDLINCYESIEVIDIPSAILAANQLRHAVLSHINPQPVSFSGAYPVGQITERANFGNVTAYHVRSEFTYFVDLHLDSKSPFARYDIGITVDSEDGSTTTNPLDETGSILSRSLDDPIGTIVTCVDSNKGVELFFDKEIYLLRSPRIEVKNGNGRPIAVEQEAFSLLPTLEWVYNQLIYAYSLHIGSNNGLAHKLNDTINAINLPNYVSIAALSELISKANAFRTKLDKHISSETYHFNPDTDIVKAQPASNLTSLTKLLLDLRQTYLRHNARNGVHDGVGNRIVSAKFFDIVRLETDRLQDAQTHNVSGMIRGYYFNNGLSEPRYTDDSINEFFIGSADRPSLASVLPKSGLVNSNGEISLESDSVEFYFSKHMQEVSLDSTNIIITGGSIQQKVTLWKNDMVANTEVIKMEQIGYDGSAVGLFDKAGNPIY